MNYTRFVCFVFCVLTTVLASCSFFGVRSGEVTRVVRKLLGYPDDPYLTPIPDAPKAYKEAFALLDKGDHKNAIVAFSAFLRDQPSTQWTLAAQFNWARSLEAIGEFSAAAEKYQETIENARNAPRLQGLALLRLAVVLEALGEADRSLAALKDAEKRVDHMPPEIALTELPARLAAAYARERNFIEAERYFAKADRSLGRMRAQMAKNERPEWLPRVLYAMGHRPQVAIPWDQFDESILPVERSQIYLLQSAELAVEPWASKSASELMGVYRALRASIDVVPLPNVTELVVAAREQQQQRWRRLVRLGDAVAQLRSLFVIEIARTSPEGSHVRQIVDFADQLEENIQSSLMLERPVGQERK